ncbi:MAG: tRNA lysidine(34) synthetase TilS [bacterium]
MSTTEVIFKKVQDTIRKYQMLASNTKLVVAVSGGPDSATLLHVLFKLGPKYNLRLWVAHLNHGLRGREADLEAEWVKKFAFKLGIPVISDTFNVSALAKEKKLSLEEAARRARYNFLEEVASQMGASKIALAHTASDQAETLLMRLMRGSGLDGLSAIPPVRNKIIRPLIEVFRGEIQDYCRENNFQPCLDSSNRETSFLRNRVRLNLIPYLSREYGDKIEDVLFQTTNLLRQDSEYLKKETERVFKSVLEKKTDEELVFNEQKLSCLHPALQRRVIRRAIEKIKGNLRGITFDHIVSILKLYQTKQSKQLDLPHSLVIRHRYGNLLIRKGKEKSLTFVRNLVIPGTTKLTELNLALDTELISITPGISFHKDGQKKLEGQFISSGRLSTHFPLASTDELKSCQIADFPEREAWFDFNKLESPLFLRTREKGDRFHPLGMAGSKKVKDFFIDLKIPSEQRKRVPLLIGKDKVVWIVGYRIDQRFKVDEDTRAILKVKIRESHD